MSHSGDDSFFASSSGGDLRSPPGHSRSLAGARAERERAHAHAAARRQYGLPPADPTYRPHGFNVGGGGGGDDSLEFDEDDSAEMYARNSTPVPRGRAGPLFTTANPDAADVDDPDESFPDASFAEEPSFAGGYPDESYGSFEDDPEGIEVDGTEVPEHETTYGESDGSSAAYDPDDDPEAWAERLDELAGVLEMSEVEARALRWGPAVGRERDAADLPLEQFQAVLDHHLETTAWRFEPREAAHPVRVLGRAWVGTRAGERISVEAAQREVQLENGGWR
ncbi:uncharacterized protein LOC62_01G001421 [Vanrija pseudolonga]|uniref:Uncharacterized protein n=1 Tax=Vanrija pseudolonga TaxID=143232 RepID=A0AAF1BNB0_9TREE|nr:hypothetical protein LOC62_01G001421 [Vanrija pseudolonga]